MAGVRYLEGMFGAAEATTKAINPILSTLKSAAKTAGSIGLSAMKGSAPLLKSGAAGAAIGIAGGGVAAGLTDGSIGEGMLYGGMTGAGIGAGTRMIGRIGAKSKMLEAKKLFAKDRSAAITSGSRRSLRKVNEKRAAAVSGARNAGSIKSTIYGGVGGTGVGLAAAHAGPNLQGTMSETPLEDRLAYYRMRRR